MNVSDRSADGLNSVGTRMDTHDACHESRRRDGVNPAGLSRRVFDFKQLLMDIPRLRQAMRTQRISVAKLGGLPNISTPMRNTLAANHSAP